MQNQWLALFLHDRINKYQLLLRDDAEATARRHVHKVTVYWAEKNAALQEAQIRSVLKDCKKSPPAAILVSPVSESGLISAMNEAASERIPWIYLCRWSDTINAVRRDRPGYLAFSVAADQTQIGRLQGQMLARLITEKHELVYIQGPQGTSSVSRRHNALRRELEYIPGLRWAPYNSDWSIEGGADMMRRWLGNFKRGKLPQFAVCAQNDDMAWGARMALAESGHITREDRTIIIGCDGLPTFGQRLVSEGMLTATVAVPSVAGRALDELFRALNMKLNVPAELSINVLPHPPLAQLTKPVEVFEKPLASKQAPATSVAPVIVSAPPVSRPKAAVSTTSAVRNLSSTPKVDPNDDTSKLFALTLKQVALSSRMATATRSITGANGASVQSSQLQGSSSSGQDATERDPESEMPRPWPGRPKKSPEPPIGGDAKNRTQRGQ